MKAVRLEAPEHLALIDWPDAGAPGPGEALVHVRRVGVCGTDHHSFLGRQPFFAYPRILGHELAVEIAEVGPRRPAGDAGLPGGGGAPPTREACAAPDLEPGQRCALAPYLFCGACAMCRRGRTNCCGRLKVLGVHVDGGMRERLIVPRVNLHASATLSVDELAVVEPLAIGAHAAARAGIEPGEEALVIGAGPIGLATAQAAQAAGARVIVSETHGGRRDFARTFLGEAPVIAPGDDLRAVLRSGDELPAVVFDATGSLASMRSAFDYVAPGGRLVLVGLAQGEVTFDDPAFHRRELTLLATRNATGDDFRRVIGLLEAGRLDAASWITHRATLDELPALFGRWMDPASGCLKGMVEVS